MSNFWMHLPDFIALIIVVGCILLIASGRDGEIKGILGVASGFIFGRYAPLAYSKISEKTLTKD